MLRQLVLATAAALTLTLPAKADTLKPFNPLPNSSCYNTVVELPGYQSYLYGRCIPSPVVAEDLTAIGVPDYLSNMLMGFQAIERSKNFTSVQHLQAAKDAFRRASISAFIISDEHKYLREFYIMNAMRADIALDRVLKIQKMLAKNSYCLQVFY